MIAIMTRSKSRFKVYAGSLLLLVTSQASVYSALSAEELEVLDAVTGGIALNDSLIESFHGVFETTTQKHYSSQPQPVAPDSGGANMSSKTPERTTYEYQYWASGENERYEQQKGERKQIDVIKDGVASSYSSDRKMALVADANAIAYFNRLDPRNAGFFLEGFSLRKLDAGDAEKVTSARFVEERDGKVKAEIEVDLATQGRQLVIECDSNFNFLPTLVTYKNPDGSIDASTSIEYKKVVDQPAAWFPSKVIRTHAFPNHFMSLGEAVWGQTIVTQLKSLSTNEPIADHTFIIDPPKGTEVKDFVNDIEILPDGQKLPLTPQKAAGELEGGKRRWLWLAVNAVIVAVIAFVIFIRRRMA